jgi:hypothetical protein
MARKMKAYVTSIGEPTTDLCVWSLERNGFEVELVQGSDSLCYKMNYIFEKADNDFARIDADIIVNRRFTPEMLSFLTLKDSDIWWWQFICFDMLKLDTTHSMSFIKREALPALRSNVKSFEHSNRPETELSRIKEFYNPRRFDTYSDELMGIHGLKADLKRAMRLKHVRNQMDLYDFDMAERIAKL